MENRFTIDLASDPPININMNSGQVETITLSSDPGTGTRNYNNLSNRPEINNIVLEGSMTPADLKLVSENSEAGWATMPTYFPKRGEICVYTDIARIKIGDGRVVIADLPFIGGKDDENIRAALQNHTANARIIH